MVHLPPVEVVARRYNVRLPVPWNVAFPHDRDAIRIAIGERLQQQGVDDAEDRRVGADAERQGADGDDREPWRAPQQSGAVPEIIEKGGQHIIRFEE
jgi:hypothetical protein